MKEGIEHMTIWEYCNHCMYIWIDRCIYIYLITASLFFPRMFPTKDRTNHVGLFTPQTRSNRVKIPDPDHSSSRTFRTSERYGFHFLRISIRNYHKIILHAHAH